MRRPFPQKKAVISPDGNASLYYLRYGSAGGNPDTRADTHMWRFSYRFPAGKGLFFKRPTRVLTGLISVSQPAYLIAWKEHDAKFGHGAWDRLLLKEQRLKLSEMFQTSPLHLGVSDVDDAGQSLDWLGFSRSETESALIALAQLVFMSQSSFALNNEHATAEDADFYTDTLRIQLAHPRSPIKRCYLAPEARDKLPTSHPRGEVLPSYFLWNL